VTVKARGFQTDPLPAAGRRLRRPKVEKAHCGGETARGFAMAALDVTKSAHLNSSESGTLRNEKGPQTFMASDAAEFLDEVCERLTEEGKTSRHLAALEFDSEIEHFDVLIREKPHVKGYPELADILDELSHACAEHGVSVRQLRRITFLEEEVNLTLIDVEGEQEVSIIYPISQRP
jgi:hypothetical protein